MRDDGRPDRRARSATPLDARPRSGAFFDRHLAPWAPRFFADLEKAQAAWLYAPVGTVGRVFMDIEATAFTMET